MIAELYELAISGVVQKCQDLKRSGKMTILKLKELKPLFQSQQDPCSKVCGRSLANQQMQKVLRTRKKAVRRRKKRKRRKVNTRMKKRRRKAKRRRMRKKKLRKLKKLHQLSPCLLKRKKRLKILSPANLWIRVITNAQEYKPLQRRKAVHRQQSDDHLGEAALHLSSTKL
jgi:hypothetical protein